MASGKKHLPYEMGDENLLAELRVPMYKTILRVRLLLIVGLILLADVVSGQSVITGPHALEDFRILKTTLEELHPDLYRYTSREKFNASADSIERLITSEPTPIELYLTIAPLVTQIRNGHTAIRPPRKLCDSILVLPLRLISFEGKVYVYRDLDGYAKDLRGVEIKTINDMPVDRIVQKAMQYVSVDGFNDTARFKAVVEDDLALYYALIYGESEKFRIEVADGDSHETWETNLSGIPYREFLLRYDQEEEFPWSSNKVDSSSTAVLTVRSFNNFAYNGGKKEYFHKTMKDFFKKVKEWKAERLILDIRFNGGGELKNAILLYSYLADAPFQFTKELEMASITAPSYAEFTNYQQALKFAPIDAKRSIRKSDKVFEITGHFSQRIQSPGKDSFKGELIVLVNGNTASAAGALASCIKNDKRGLIVGEENRDNYTGFSAGIPVVLTLPYSGITVSVPLRKFTYAEGADTGRGVEPDYMAPSTPRDFFNAENEVLNFAIEQLRK